MYSFLVNKLLTHFHNITVIRCFSLVIC